MTGTGTGASTSCVIVAFHRPAALEQLLHGLAGWGLELIVVNVEEDPQVKRAAAAAHAHVVGLAENLGYAAAVNAGTRAATAAVVVFMNDDVLITGDAVCRLSEVVAEGRALVVVPAVRDSTGVLEPTIMALPTVGRLLMEWCCLPDDPVPLLRQVLKVEKWRRPRTPEPVQAATAVVVCTKRSTLRSFPLPEEYFLYWEESEWCFQLQRAEHVITYHPEIHARHAGGLEDIRPAKGYLLAYNAVRCVRRTQGRRRAMWAVPIVVLWQVRLVIADAVRVPIHHDATSVRRLVARIHGLRGAIAAREHLA